MAQGRRVFGPGRGLLAQGGVFVLADKLFVQGRGLRLVGPQREGPPDVAGWRVQVVDGVPGPDQDRHKYHVKFFIW